LKSGEAGGGGGGGGGGGDVEDTLETAIAGSGSPDKALAMATGVMVVLVAEDFFARGFFGAVSAGIRGGNNLFFFVVVHLILIFPNLLSLFKKKNIYDGV